MSPFLLKGYLCLANRITFRRASNYLKETLVKHPLQAQAERFWNCPLAAALEEALDNAIYHRSYEEREPVEVRITPQELAFCGIGSASCGLGTASCCGLAFDREARHIPIEQVDRGATLKRKRVLRGDIRQDAQQQPNLIDIALIH